MKGIRIDNRLTPLSLVDAGAPGGMGTMTIDNRLSRNIYETSFYIFPIFAVEIIIFSKDFKA